MLILISYAICFLGRGKFTKVDEFLLYVATLWPYFFLAAVNKDIDQEISARNLDSVVKQNEIVRRLH